MRTGLPATTMTGHEANACRAGVGRVAVGRCRGGSRSGCRPRASRSGAAVVAGLPPRPPGGPLSLVPRRSPGANRQPAGGSGSLGCECVSHVLVRRRRGQRRPDHLGGRCAATAAPTVNGALLRPRDAHKLSYRDAPISRSSRFTVYRTDPYSAVPPAVRSSGRHTVAIILSASVCRLAVHSGNR